MAFEIGELDAGHLFLAVSPLVAVVVTGAVGWDLRIVETQERISSVGIVVLESVVHTAGIRRTLRGEEPEFRSVIERRVSVNKHVTIYSIGYKRIRCNCMRLLAMLQYLTVSLPENQAQALYPRRIRLRDYSFAIAV